MPRPADFAALLRGQPRPDTINMTIVATFDLGDKGSGEVELRGSARLSPAQPVVKPGSRSRVLEANSALIISTVSDVELSGRSQPLGEVRVTSDSQAGISVCVQDGHVCSATLSAVVEFPKIGIKLRTSAPGHIHSGYIDGAGKSSDTMDVLHPVELVDEAGKVQGCITGGRMVEHQFT
jgi:hypothetical protein